MKSHPSLHACRAGLHGPRNDPVLHNDLDLRNDPCPHSDPGPRNDLDLRNDPGPRSDHCYPDCHHNHGGNHYQSYDDLLHHYESRNLHRQQTKKET